jgi:hypothetical protein
MYNLFNRVTILNYQRENKRESKPGEEWTIVSTLGEEKAVSGELRHQIKEANEINFGRAHYST